MIQLTIALKYKMIYMNYIIYIYPYRYNMHKIIYNVY